MIPKDPITCGQMEVEIRGNAKVVVFLFCLCFFYLRKQREASLLASHLPLSSRSSSLEAFLPVSHLADILAPLIATFAGRVGIQVRPRKQMVFNFKYY